MTKTMSILAGTALALTLSACGSEKASDTSSGSGSGPVSSTTPATAPSPAPSGSATNQGIIPDDVWAGTFKKAIPPLADVPNDELVAAGKKLCADFTAAPTAATAKAGIAAARTTWKLDSVQANIWTGGAIARFCNDQGTAFLTASIG